MGAAESFELARDWESAVGARDRAIAALSAANLPDLAEKERHCRALNKERKRCIPEEETEVSP